jgi:hypothetical protein
LPGAGNHGGRGWPVSVLSAAVAPADPRTWSEEEEEDDVVTIERLDDDTLQELARRTDRLGVLSVYAHADPARDHGLEGLAIDLRNRYRELLRRIADADSGDRGRELAAALERLQPEVEALAHPTGSGRGRILFAALDADWTLRLDSALPVPNRVVLDDNPFIHPLLEMLDEGQPTGVVLVSPEDGRLLDWRLGRLRLLGRLDREYVQAPHERAGQIGGGPAGQFHSPMREQRQARERDLAQRFLADVVAAAVQLADERRWGRFLVSGGERWTEQVAAAFPERFADHVIRDPRVLGGLDDAALAAAVTERLAEEHAAQERRLVERVRDTALARGGALGLSEVTAALNSGRVAHLVYDPEVRYTGSVGADGALYAQDEVGPAGSGTPEPRLTERLVERALATGARVTPVEGAARGALAEAQGIAALLRW